MEDPNAAPMDNGIGDPNAMPADDGMEDPNAMPADDGMEDPNAAPEDEALPGETEDDESKKEIQRKTGELSQLLNDFTGTDEKLEKYVRGMIDSALENFGENSSEEEPQEEMPTEDTPAEEPQGEMPTESIRFTKAQINKLNEEIISQKKLRKKERPNKKESPFNAPRFK